MKKLKIFTVAGEESANQYLKNIIDSFNDQAEFSGIAFSNLKTHMNITFAAEKLSVMGFVEVFYKWRTLKTAFKTSVDFVLKEKPDVVLLIDFGGFNLRLAKKIKEVSPETKIHYFISPKIWAWGQKRALKVKKYIDEMYVIHPFEVDFYKKWQVDAKFVGHPLIKSLEKDYFDQDWIDLEKSRCGLGKRKKVFGVMLGSRNSEINRHKDKFCQVAKEILSHYSDFEIAFIIPPSKTRDEYKELLSDIDFPFLLLQDEEPMSRIALCDYFLVASGTATLQVALLNKPMAVGYMMNGFTMWLARRYVTGIQHVSLVNILNQKEVVPEFLQEEVQVGSIFKYFKELIENKEKQEALVSELKKTRALLTEQDAYEAVKNEITLSLS